MGWGGVRHDKKRLVKRNNPRYGRYSEPETSRFLRVSHPGLKVVSAVYRQKKRLPSQTASGNEVMIY